MKCTHCQSTEYWKAGYYETKKGKKRRYKCKDCLRKFSRDDTFTGMEKSPDTINKALDLYCNGLSLRKVAKQLWKLFKIKISHTTIWTWIQKYIPKTKKLLKKVIPERLSGLWHADEMMIRLAGKEYWQWNMIDHDSRYIINYRISKNRNMQSINRFLNKAKVKSGNKAPHLLITDGLQGYRRAFNKVFGSVKYPNSQHFRAPSLRDKKNNNRVERFHGTMRDRLKTMRGIKGQSINSPLIEMLVQHYNLFRTHQSLDDKTPAQFVGIPKEYRTDWKTLIQQANKVN